MIKHALYSYVNAIHPRNIKEVKGRIDWFMIFYIFFVYPVFVDLPDWDANSLFDNLKGSFILLCKIFPFVLMLWSNLQSKFMMGKQMYICPMSMEERKEYIGAVLLVKIGIPFIIGVLADIVWSYFVRIDVVRSFALYLIYLTWGIAIYTCIELKGRNDKIITWGRKRQGKKAKRAWLNIFATVVSFILLLGFEMTSLEAITTEESSLAPIIIICYLILIALDISMIARGYKIVLESQSDYETNFRVRSEVPVNE